MKPWMKILMWLGLGGGIGFFAGYQAGNRSGYKAGKAVNPVPMVTATRPDITISADKVDIGKALHVYRGGDTDGDEIEMPEEPPVIGDEAEIEEIPELHPQHMIPNLITEEDYYENPWGYDQESLYFYDVDKVLFNRETRKAITNKDEMDQVIGIGMTFSFVERNGEVRDAIFVKNDTMGVLFRIDRLDESYCEYPDAEYEEDDTE